MLQSIVNFIQSIFGTIVNTFNGIASLLVSLFDMTTIMGTVVSWFPPIVAAMVMTTISVLIIKFVLGR